MSVGQVIYGGLGECGGKLGLRLKFVTSLTEVCGRSGRRVRERGILQRFEIAEVIRWYPNGTSASADVLGAGLIRRDPQVIIASSCLDDRLLATGGVAWTAIWGGGQWASARFNVITPTIISATPTTFATDTGESRNSTAISTMAAVPMADHNA